ncbi:MAG: arabinosyltransferase domain-containing protein [Corynebacterium sp.]|nr:arabinosyltransferase domain-containing protein [Corynebacterium sp.]
MTKSCPGWVKYLAIISGVLGALCFILIPFLPVKQVQSSISWPQNDTTQSVSAPLISYTATDFEADVPISSVNHLIDDSRVILSTLPVDYTNAPTRGLVVRYTGSVLEVVLRNRVPLDIPREELATLPQDAVIHISSKEEGTTVTVSGTDLEGEVEGDYRPQITGVYSDLSKDSQTAQELTSQGLKVNIQVDSRYTSSPTLLKSLAIWGGLVLLLISLFCLWRMDHADIDKATKPRMLPRRWYIPQPLDILVVAILGFWHIFGANTSDDGYLLTMGREAQHASYMANYYRWFGVPESPFGAPYYDLLGFMTKVSTNSVWMRLPATIAALAIWFLLSRCVLPRLGRKIRFRQAARWTAAFAFLAVWLPYNNGLRPEPVVALGALLTWVCFERAIVTERLFPAALGVIIATVSLAAGPTGLMAVAAILAALSALIRILYQRIQVMKGSRAFNAIAYLAPFLPSGLAILIAVFADQTLASVMESIRVRKTIGPSLAWYNEYVRYQTLMQSTVDGSFARRLPIFLMFAAVVVIIGVTLNRGKVPGANRDAAWRLLLMFLGTLFFFMFTPTKWSHHFGTFAGIIGALAALGAVAVTTLTANSRRNRWMMLGGVAAITAFALAGPNGWWYASSYGIPWWDKTIQLKGIEAATVMLGISLLILLIGVVLSYRIDARKARAETTGTEYTSDDGSNRHRRFNRIVNNPLGIAYVVIVLFSMASLAKGFVAQYPAYSIGKGNLEALKGNTCNLASEVRVESNTNASFLQPADGSPLGDSLIDTGQGFGPNNIPASIAADDIDVSSASAGTISGSVSSSGSASSGDSAESLAAESGLRAEPGINGSHAKLPFGLDYRTVPMVGSYSDSAQSPANLKTKWYSLPARSENTPLLVVSAAGRIKHHDMNGVEQDGQEITIEYGTIDASGNVTNTGEIEPIDIGPTPAWRNLRVPMTEIPTTANVVRIVANDKSLDKNEWLAVTPPRVPELEPLTQVITPSTPTVIDWAVGLQFPCEHPYWHYAGVTEVPEYRISPDYSGKVTLTPWQDYEGGGTMGIYEALGTAEELPTYLNNNWQRDWGSVEKLDLRQDASETDPVPAKIDYQTITRSGLWSPGHIKTKDEN